MPAGTAWGHVERHSLGATRRRCYFRVPLGPELWSDVDFHPVETIFGGEGREGGGGGGVGVVDGDNREIEGEGEGGSGGGDRNSGSGGGVGEEDCGASGAREGGAKVRRREGGG